MHHDVRQDAALAHGCKGLSTCLAFTGSTCTQRCRSGRASNRSTSSAGQLESMRGRAWRSSGRSGSTSDSSVQHFDPGLPPEAQAEPIRSGLPDNSWVEVLRIRVWQPDELLAT